jgi:hypothetical protein
LKPSKVLIIGKSLCHSGGNVVTEESQGGAVRKTLPHPETLHFVQGDNGLQHDNVKKEHKS